MSDSGRDNGKLPVHPAVTAWRAWRQDNPESFSGEPRGEYLANRLELAFYDGWNAATKRAGTAALTGKAL
jgi:hypothetical protein